MVRRECGSSGSEYDFGRGQFAMGNAQTRLMVQNKLCGPFDSPCRQRRRHLADDLSAICLLCAAAAF